MKKYTAHLYTTASATITADVPDDVAKQGAEAISEWIEMNAPDSPTLCAQCSGWGRKVSLDLGDFETVVNETGPNKDLAFVTDENGNEIN
jgi:hypothetical protein